MPVTHDALEASWERFTGVGPIGHGTAIEALSGIAREGVVPQARTRVHLTSGHAEAERQCATLARLHPEPVPRAPCAG